jgi:4-nitrophenyl phosphatase
MRALSDVRGVISDMDGVLWRGTTPLPGVRAALGLLRERGVPFVLATNNATATFDDIRQRLTLADVAIGPAEVYTSAEAAAEYVGQHFPVGSNVLPIGEAGLREALTQAGMRLSERADGVVAVVAGLDRSVTWDRITEAAMAIRNGAAFIGTNADATFPSERGLVPGAGALLAALQTATSCAPTVIGKPEPHLFLMSLARLETPAEDTLVLGDRLETDILGGQRAGMLTGLLLTGVTDRRQLADSPIKPDWVFEDLNHFCRAFRGEAV